MPDKDGVGLGRLGDGIVGAERRDKASHPTGDGLL
jgi:hypothetical protein